MRKLENTCRFQTDADQSDVSYKLVNWTELPHEVYTYVVTQESYVSEGAIF